jgi:hypothetical protein
MDPQDVKIMLQRQGAVDISDFDEVLRVRRPKRRKKRERYARPKDRGCPMNDMKSHIYVWVDASEKEKYGYSSRRDDIFKQYFGFSKEEAQACAGCGKFGKTRMTERYMKIKERRWFKMVGEIKDQPRGEPIGGYRGRWSSGSFYGFHWEYQEAGYVEAYNDYIMKKNYPEWMKVIVRQ